VTLLLGYGFAENWIVAELRLLEEADAEAVVALYRAAWGDSRPIDAAEVVSWLRGTNDPGLCRVLEHDGRIVGYGDLEISPDAVTVDVAAPGHWDTVLQWAEETARARNVPRVRVLLYAENELAEALARRGYRYWRSAFKMEIDLDDPVPRAHPPDDVELRDYADADAELLRNALNEAFREDPFHHETGPDEFRTAYLGERGFDPSLWRLAWDGHELAAFVIAFAERHGDKTLGYVHALGVRTAWRQRGIGRALLLDVLKRFQKRGLARATLGVDAENVTKAMQLYESIGMRIVSRGDNWVLDFRPKPVAERSRAPQRARRVRPRP
jgi:mycothiol synthase